MKEELIFELKKKNIIIKNGDDYVINPQATLNCMEKSLSFSDIAIKQQKNVCESRLHVDTESEIVKGVKIKVPLIASNMSTVVNPKFYITLHKLGAFAILHRADSKKNIINNIETISNECEWVAASLGIEEDQLDFAKEMIRKGCNIITIDIAHGYSDKILNLARKIKKFSSETKIIIGNTTNISMLEESYEYVDAIKVGIAQGFACETKNTAGCTEKQFSVVYKFRNISKQYGIPIISDGSISEPADFVKSVGAGANSAMAGKVFAACPESAAEIHLWQGSRKKLYAGMASRYVQDKWKGGLKKGTCPEGGVRYLNIGEPAEDLVERYLGALRSGITYSGANDIKSFQENVEFVRV